MKGLPEQQLYKMVDAGKVKMHELYFSPSPLVLQEHAQTFWSR